MTDPQHALAAAAASASPVSVKRADGRVSYGVPVLVEPETYKILTGKRGRPAIVAADAVVEVSA